MQVVSSYGAEIKNKNIPIRHTLALYREAVRCLTEIYETVWTELSMIDQIKRRFNEAEHLVHETKKNHARFDFDARFPKMPSYLRRAAIQHALGSVSSYHTRLEQWKNGAISGKPKLVYENHAMPVFYQDVMYKPGEESEDAACLKLYDGHDWKWFRAGLLHTDMEYLRRHWSGKKSSAPVLEKRRQKYFLRFSYTEEVTLSKTPVKDQIICRFQKEHGSKQIGSRWAYAKRLNTELARKTARSIAEYARENHADVIVFEYLEMKGKISGKKRQKLHLWKKREIQTMCEHKAHRYGIRVSRVCAWNTSRLAYDGSGPVSRDPKNHSLCVFQSGKQYNCDLSASYNIGARYWIREIIKTLPETERSSLEAKVPAVKRRTSCVYADLLILQNEYGCSKAA